MSSSLLTSYRRDDCCCSMVDGLQGGLDKGLQFDHNDILLFHSLLLYGLWSIFALMLHLTIVPYCNISAMVLGEHACLQCWYCRTRPGHKVEYQIQISPCGQAKLLSIRTNVLAKKFVINSFFFYKSKHSRFVVRWFSPIVWPGYNKYIAKKCYKIAKQNKPFRRSLDKKLTICHDYESIHGQTSLFDPKL